MNKTILPGKVVRLRCGGPKMVVSEAAPAPPAFEAHPWDELCGPPGPRPAPGPPSAPRPPAWVLVWQIQGAVRFVTLPEDVLELVEEG